MTQQGDLFNTPVEFFNRALLIARRDPATPAFAADLERDGLVQPCTLRSYSFGAKLGADLQAWIETWNTGQAEADRIRDLSAQVESASQLREVRSV